MNDVSPFRALLRYRALPLALFGWASTAFAASVETRNIAGTLTDVMGDVSVSTGTRSVGSGFG
jgi:hypothetical protein